VKYYEHYVKRLRESIARGPAAESILPLLDVFDAFEPEVRFRMVQELERVLRDVASENVDWQAGLELVRQAAAQASDPDDFGRRLRSLAGS
jgi:hypothetical protein